MKLSKNKLASIVIVLSTIAGNGIFSSNTQFSNEKYTLDATPDGWAFSIWTVIYAGLAYLAFASEFNSNEIKLLLLTGILNNLWLVVWGKQNVPIATLTLVTLCVLVWRLLYISKIEINRSIIGIYAGWTTVAALLNVSILLNSQNILNKKGASVFFIVLISLILIYYNQTIKKKYPRTVLGTFVWASSAIALKGYLPGFIPLSLGVLGLLSN